MTIIRKNTGGIFISPTYKLAYINSAKAACTTLRYVMGKLENPDIDPQITMVDLDPYLIRDDGIYNNPDYKLFTVCRNPYSRAVSYYRYQHKPKNGIFKDMTFEDYIRMIDNTHPRHLNRHNCTQWDNLHMDKVDVLLHLENFEEELRKEILDPIGVDIPIPKRKDGGQYDYRSYYNDYTKSVVERLYSIDFKNLGYKW